MDWGSLPVEGPREIKARLDLVGVARSLGIDLRRVDGRWLALCPFHLDTNPSFDVYPDGRRCGCRACGWDGDVLDLLRALHPECSDFPSTLRVAKGLVDCVRPETTETDERPPPPDFDALYRDAVESRAILSLDALREARDIRAPGDWIRSQFGVGESDPAGVFVPHVSISPVFKITGAKVRRAASGWLPRALYGSQLNELYGIHRDHLEPTAVLVEGESDTWTTSYDLRDEAVLVVGLPSGAGSRIRDEWVNALSWRTVVLCLDADPAGREARDRWRAALPYALVADLPSGTDPNSCGGSVLMSALRGAR